MRFIEGLKSVSLLDFSIVWRLEGVCLKLFINKFSGFRLFWVVSL